jgi:integrase
MLTVDEEQRILGAAPPHLRVAIVLLVQTGGRTYSEGFSLKRAWRTALIKANVPYFPIYNLRHVFCTRLSWVAPDAVVQRAMRHSSPDTKRRYQLGLIHQVRERMKKPIMDAIRYIFVTVTSLRKSRKLRRCVTS